MRDVLLERVRPLVEQLAEDLADIAARRIEAELDRVKEAFEVAASSYASEPDLLTVALDPELAGMLASMPAELVSMSPREALSSRMPPVAPNAPRERAPAVSYEVSPTFAAGRSFTVPEVRFRKDGKRQGVPTCRKCGHVGGNSRGCGTAHPTLAERRAEAEQLRRDLEPQPANIDRTPVAIAVEPPKVRTLKPTPDAREARKAQITARAKPTAPPRPQAVEPDPDDDEPERWSSDRITHETQQAEASKHEGELPVPSSSFVVDQDERIAGMSAVRELEAEAELDFRGRD